MCIKLATGLYPETEEYIPILMLYFFSIHLNIILKIETTWSIIWIQICIFQYTERQRTAWPAEWLWHPQKEFYPMEFTYFKSAFPSTKNYSLKITIFWDVTACNLVYNYRTAWRHFPECSTVPSQNRDGLESDPLTVMYDNIHVQFTYV
jgi:hypothetical protein